MPEHVTLHAERWFNAPAGFTLDRLRGRAVLLHTFQLLCPGCVLHAIPQIARVEALGLPGIAIVGLHTVFEHHEAMTPTVLAAFLHEYRIHHPVAVDAPGEGSPVPRTMAALGLRGTPSLLLLDHRGVEVRRWFGAVDDLDLGRALGRAEALAGACDGPACRMDG
ncbi:MAG: hypothetical protein RLZZ127_3171 [Planctomycetota bacterium]|jgi:hypothetical protein